MWGIWCFSPKHCTPVQEWFLVLLLKLECWNSVALLSTVWFKIISVGSISHMTSFSKKFIWVQSTEESHGPYPARALKFLCSRRILKTRGKGSEGRKRMLCKAANEHLHADGVKPSGVAQPCSQQWCSVCSAGCAAGVLHAALQCWHRHPACCHRALFSAGFDGFTWVSEFRHHTGWSGSGAQRQQGCICFVYIEFGTNNPAEAAKKKKKEKEVFCISVYYQKCLRKEKKRNLAASCWECCWFVGYQSSTHYQLTAKSFFIAERHLLCAWILEGMDVVLRMCTECVGKCKLVRAEWYVCRAVMVWECDVLRAGSDAFQLCCFQFCSIRGSEN